MANRPLDTCRLQLLVVRPLCPRRWRDAVQAAIAGGVDLVQLREKGARTREVVEVARELLAITEPANVPLLIDDDVAAARKLGSAIAGVHLGQEDLPVEMARARLGNDAWIGVSTHAELEVGWSERTSATHYGLGACFATATKRAHRLLTFESHARARARQRPVFAIGGITPENVGCWRARRDARRRLRVDPRRRRSAGCGGADPRGPSLLKPSRCDSRGAATFCQLPRDAAGGKEPCTTNVPAAGGRARRAAAARSTSARSSATRCCAS
jgi:thiamine-phosphate pyrophosphorylase